MALMQKLLPVIFATLLLAPVVVPNTAVAADAVVGTATLELEDKARNRKLATELWFEAAPGANVDSFSPRAPLRTIAIARNAEPRDLSGKRPLIVLSHGNWG